MIDKTITIAPHALMLLSSHCAHCPNVLDSLSKMIKTGDIGSFEVINLEKNPDAMGQYNVRSVPWVKIGKHQLTGAQTLEALKQRAEWARKDLIDNSSDEIPKNQTADFDILLSDGKVNEVIEALKKDDSGFESIMSLLGDKGTVLSTRIGIGVVFEEFSGSTIVKNLIPELADLAKQSDDIRIRADSLHYLGMTNDQSAIEALENYSLKKDDDDEIKEIISDSLEGLRESLTQ